MNVELDFSECKTRKEHLEVLAAGMEQLSPEASAQAWQAFASQLGSLSSPDTPRMPRFRDIFLGLYSAYLRGALKDFACSRQGAGVKAGPCRQKSTATEITRRS